MPDNSHISVTAKVAAYYRQFSDIPFAQEVSKLIGAGAAVDQIVKDHRLDAEKLTFYAPMFEARYKSLTQLIRESSASQVLEIASGYSMRGLDLTRAGEIRYVETDLPDVIAAKLSLLEKVRRQHAIRAIPHHVVTSADATNLDELRASVSCLDPSRALTVLCEGLIMYLSRDETEKLSRNIRELLGEFAGGCWITPDFTFKSDARDLSPERIRMREAISGVTQRQIETSAFEDGRDLVEFFGRMGFNVQVRNQVDETPSFSSIHALGLPVAAIERLRGVLRVWILTIAP